MVKQFVVIELEHGFIIAVHGPFVGRDNAVNWGARNVQRPAQWSIRGLDEPE